MLTARAEPTMVLITAEVKERALTLNAPGMPAINVKIPQNTLHHADYFHLTFRVWGEKTLGVDCGDEVSQWLSDFLKKEYRLVYHPQINFRGITSNLPKYNKLNANKGKIIYHDEAPCNILSEASLEDLNSRLKSKLTVRSFRPNILVKDCAPFEEDNWSYIKIGEAELSYACNCSRCLLTTVDMDKGIKHPDMEPLTTLRKYRLCKPEDRPIYGNSPLFGISLNIIKEGKLKVGDIVYAC
ncbi:mitochondrial amidoxime reducing component 2-like [Clavelina lepadiformis]|uniref:mitochondrial amidoxime reducing component 2-like n=1 Tax=Clavelina lepadiformis TaxID=159417 RepID=UPI004042C705